MRSSSTGPSCRELSTPTSTGRSAKATELAHALELTVVAEGVETEQILDRLARLGCDEAQGWHVARAMSAEELMGWSAAYLATLANDEVWRGVPQQKVCSPLSATSSA